MDDYARIYFSSLAMFVSFATMKTRRCLFTILMVTTTPTQNRTMICPIWHPFVDIVMLPSQSYATMPPPKF
jgi:hypothetical protein